MISKSKKKIRVFLLTSFLMCQLLIAAGSNRYLFSTASGWNYLSIGGIFFSIAGVIILNNILKKNETRESIEWEIREKRYSEKLNDLYNNNIILQSRHLEEMKEEMMTTLDQFMVEQKRKDCSALNTVALKQEIYCANPLVQAILYEKVTECENTGAKLQTQIRLGDIPGIAKVHLCSLFTNLLDNAIAAVQNESVERKNIYIKAGTKAEYLIVEVINPASGEYMTKSPSPNHGYGKKILQDIAMRYEGYYEEEMKSDIYKATVILRTGMAI